jgi:hypothetical protein
VVVVVFWFAGAAFPPETSVFTSTSSSSGAAPHQENPSHDGSRQDSARALEADEHQP